MILVVIDCLIKMIYYKLIIIIIDVASLAKVIISQMIRYYDLLESIIYEQSLLFT